MAFDPDAFLAEPGGVVTAESPQFDPDKFLAEPEPFDPDKFLAGESAPAPKNDLLAAADEFLSSPTAPTENLSQQLTKAVSPDPSVERGEVTNIGGELSTTSAGEMAKEFALGPTVELPRVPQQEGVLKQLGAAAANAGIGLVESMTSPVGAVTALALPGAPSILQKAVAAGFGAHMIKSGGEALGAAETLQQGAEAVLNTALGAAAIGHAAGRPGATPELKTERSAILEQARELAAAGAPETAKAAIEEATATPAKALPEPRTPEVRPAPTEAKIETPIAREEPAAAVPPVNEGPVTATQYGRTLDAYDAFANVQKPSPASPIETAAEPRTEQVVAGRTSGPSAATEGTISNAGQPSQLPPETKTAVASEPSRAEQTINGAPATAPAPLTPEQSARADALFREHYERLTATAERMGASEPSDAATDAILTVAKQGVEGDPSALLMENLKQKQAAQWKAATAEKRDVRKTVSLDEPSPVTGEAAVESVPARESKPSFGAEEQTVIDRAGLSDAERRIVDALKTGEYDSVAEAGEVLGLSRDAAAKVFRSAEAKLRETAMEALSDETPSQRAAVRKAAAKGRGIAKAAADQARAELGPGAANAEEFAALAKERADELATIGAAHLLDTNGVKSEWLDAMREEYGLSYATSVEMGKIWRDAHAKVEEIYSPQGKKLPIKQQIAESVTGRKPLISAADTAETLKVKLRQMVTRAEAFAEYLRGQEKGSKIGAGTARAELRENIRIADKWMEADRAKVRDTLLDFASNLSLNERAKFLPAITNALRRVPVLSRDPAIIFRRAEDVLNRITGAIYEQGRKEAITRIDKLLEKNEAAQNMTIPEKQAIRQRGVTFKALKDKMSLDMLEAMEARMQEIRRAGKELFVLDEVVKAEKVAATLREIEQQGVRKIDAPEQIRPALGETETAWNRRLSEMRRAPAFIRHYNLALTPFDWIIQTFDKKVSGPLRKMMKEPVDVLFGEWLDTADAYKKTLVEISQRHNLQPGNFDRIGVHAELRQPGGLENLEAKGFTKKEIDSARTLSRGELEWLRKADEINQHILPQVEKVLNEFYHQEIEKVPGYFPRQRDWDYYNSLSIEEGRFAKAHGRTNTEKGFTISRVGATTKNLTNAQDIMAKHIDDAIYHIKMGPELRRLADTIKTKEFQNMAGTWGQRVFSDWVDVLSRNGGVGSGRRIAAVDSLRKNVGMAQLAFRLTTTALQPLSLVQGMALVSPKNMGKALTMMARSSNREFVLKNFPEIRHRVGDDPAYSVYQGSSVRDQWARAGFHFISALDRLSAMTTGLGAYLDGLESAGIKFDPAAPLHEPSVQAAQLAVRKTQSSAYPKDLPLALSRGNFTGNASVDKAIFQFQNFLINKWALTKNGALQMGIEEKSAKAGARIMTFLILGTVLEELGREGIKRGIQATFGSTDAQQRQDKQDAKEGKSFAGKIAERAAVDFATGMPVVSNLAGMAKFEGSGIPLVDVVQNALEGGVRAVEGKHTSTKAAGSIRAAQSVGALLGVPTGQVGDLAVQAVRVNKDILDKNDKKKAKGNATESRHK